jgi:hypothetical protein
VRQRRPSRFTARAVAIAAAALITGLSGPSAASGGDSLGRPAPVPGPASIWERAAGPPGAAAYRKAMGLGDLQAARAASLANAGYPGRANSMALKAVAAYEAAIEIDPGQGEPHYRAAEVLYGHFVTETITPFPEPTRRAIEHWDQFEKKSPQDPRLEEMLFRRAFTCTKLGGEEMFRRAVADYAAELRLLDAATAPPATMANVLSNRRSPTTIRRSTTPTARCTPTAWRWRSIGTARCPGRARYSPPTSSTRASSTGPGCSSSRRGTSTGMSRSATRAWGGMSRRPTTCGAI